jgi:site-specific DNA recombinase
MLKNMTTRAIAYLRVSLEKQAELGVSLDGQRAKIEAYASLYEIEIVEFITDAGESAKSLSRPGLEKARGMLRRKEADALIVAKLDRLTRSVKDLGELLESDFKTAGLLSVSEQIDARTAGGRLVLNILGSVSQWERETIGERTSAAMRHMASNGEFIGGRPPYGFAVCVCTGQLSPAPDEQAVIEVAKSLRALGLSLSKVASELERRGHRSRTAKVFAPMQIARMVA